MPPSTNIAISAPGSLQAASLVTDQAHGAPEALLCGLARSLHAHGLAAQRLEQTVEALGRHLELELVVLSTPTSVQLAVESGASQRLFLLRPAPEDLNLSKIAELDALIDEVLSNRTSPGEALVRLHTIQAAPPRFSRRWVLLAQGLASASAARLFGGSASDVLVACTAGLLVAVALFSCRPYPNVLRAFDALAALALTLAVTLIGAEFLALNIDLVVLSGLIVLVPGYTVTVALSELAERHLVSGTARLAGAAVSFMIMGIGIGLGRQVVERWHPIALEAVASMPLPQWSELLAIALTPLCFTVLLQARPKDAPAILCAGVLAFFGARLGAGLVGPELGAFVGALALGTFSNARARFLRRPASLTTSPALMLLVPGSIGFRSVTEFIGHDHLSGIEGVVRTLIVACALVGGLLFANILLPPRREL